MPTVLLTNDDGPPSPTESPYVLGLYQLLSQLLGWDIKVVLPSTQKSWIGKAYHIKETIRGVYYYPTNQGKGETSAISRPLKDGELAEWILLDGTPATCANIALNNLWPGKIDLVISGPNLGRNTSAAFALSSGTIGAALSSSLCMIRSIALSYGTVIYPIPASYHQPAHRLGCRIIQYLWHNWGQDQDSLRSGEVDLYSINIPLIDGLLTEEGLKIYWTNIWRNSYGRLFKAVSIKHVPEQIPPDVLLADGQPQSEIKGNRAGPALANSGNLVFRWAPEMKGLIAPSPSVLPVGSDGWAIYHGHVSVTPLCANFGEPHTYQNISIEDRIWKLKL